MKQIRVLQFIAPSGFYGAERWVLALANNIDEDAMVCDLVVTRESPNQDLRVAEGYPASAGDVHYLDMNGRFDLMAIRRLVQIIRDRKIDVLLSHGYKSDIIGLVAAKWARIRCVSTPHGYSGNVGLKLRAFIHLGTSVLRYFDAVAPLSEELADDMKRFKVPADRIRFIRNGVDLKDIDGTLSSLNPNDHKPPGATQCIGFIGQLIPRKGLPDLLDAFDRLHSESDSLRLRIVGDGRQRPELESKCRGMASGSAVEFLGFRDDRLALLSAFDLFVMTSSLEGIPRCLMEAMAAGIPVVAYDIPGVDQLVEHEVTGMLAPYGDVDSLVACCRRVLNDSELRGRLVDNARERVDSVYSARRMATEYQSLFTELLSTKETTDTKVMD
nr:glycosyltransferase [uncultured Marinobacter sp.]